ncbi:DUF4249 domain-containing protein [Pontibacter sp. HSC-14F20]|uniref:DUF4249 family protein n=1 Tax=Pontibacter sp. HSC-14F20 TaxID=2864136 RepID=UPI001C73C580|nr:DUF4249 family protein [Pontibacter sp. HSC-14F20]MBX0335005.1 DUF4249 domain-containing protein [Pontibacter sp. HSC-14F20]
MQLRYFLLLLLLSFLTACEENLTIDIPAGQEKLVVEGHIEQGAPPVVVLTRSRPVFAGFSPADIEDSFVHGAQVVVSSGGQSYTLKEAPAVAFRPELRRVVSEQFAIPEEQLTGNSNFIFYVYTSEELLGEVGKSYQLRISYEGRVLTSSTTIPNLNPLQELFMQPHPDPSQDSLFTLFYRYQDPDTIGNSIRYFTKRNSEPFYPGYFASVFNDELINGVQNLSFPLDRGEPRGQDVDFDTYSYFAKGDTVIVRWAAIDIEHYRFWYTLENERNNNGSPIGSPNTTRSNINGGLGVWGGYGVTYHQIVVE